MLYLQRCVQCVHNESIHARSDGENCPRLMRKDVGEYAHTRTIWFMLVMFSCGLDYCRPMHDKSTHTFMSVRIARRLQLHHTSPHGQPLLADWFTPSTTFATDPTRSDVLMQMSYLHKQLSSCARMHCVSVHMINLSTCAHLMFVYVVCIRMQMS